MSKIPVSIMILTLNESINIEACIASVGRFSEVIVLDSFSSDDTVAKAEAAGARVVQRKFDNWAAHQNWAMENLGFAERWVFYLDADERMTPELEKEVEAIAAQDPPPHSAYYCGRKNMLMGKWIRHAMPPGMIMRFFQPDKIRFERLVNPVPVLEGSAGYLKNYFEHYNFSKGMTEWFDKHNKYSRFEAMEAIKILDGTSDAPSYSLFSSDAADRRQALKRLSFRLPFRGALKFFYLYVLQRGFLDGRAGLLYARLSAIYETMISIKIKELKREQSGNAEVGS